MKFNGTHQLLVYPTDEDCLPGCYICTNLQIRTSISNISEEHAVPIFTGLTKKHDWDTEAMQMKGKQSFKMLVSIDQSTWCNIPDDLHLHQHCCKNLIYNIN